MVHALFQSLCQRPQTLSSADRLALTTIVAEFRRQGTAANPNVAPDRENRALSKCSPDEMLSLVQQQLKTSPSPFVIWCNFFEPSDERKSALSGAVR
jgi:hypothetical protein